MAGKSLTLRAGETDHGITQNLRNQDSFLYNKISENA